MVGVEFKLLLITSESKLDLGFFFKLFGHRIGITARLVLNIALQGAQLLVEIIRTDAISLDFEDWIGTEASRD